MNKIHQQELNFNIKITSDCITSKTGLIHFFDAAIKLGLLKKIKEIFPAFRSNNHILPKDMIMSIVLMLCGGGRAMEDIRQIASDTGLRRLCEFKRIPSPDSISNWLDVKDNLSRLFTLNDYLNKIIINKSKMDEFTLDTDATDIENKKLGHEINYKGIPCHSVLLSFLPELDLCVADDYRAGATHASIGILNQIESVHTLLTGLKKKLKYFRSDSGAYQSDIIELCFKKEVIFTITADQNSSVKDDIESIQNNEWKPLYDKDGFKTEREYASTVHTMNNSKNSFTLIVQRWQDKQQNLFDKYNYYVIATNDFERTPNDIILFHNNRGNSENYNKEIKSGFGMEHVPSSSLSANAIFFRLGVIAYNLTIALKKLVLKDSWAKKTISTLRWQLIFIAGKVVYHGRQLTLKLNKSFCEQFKDIRLLIQSSLTLQT